MKNRGQTLVATLVVIAIIGVLAVAMLKGSGAFGGESASPRKDGKGQTTVGLAQYRAKDEVCRSNLGQVRLSISINTDADENRPASLQDLKLPKEFSLCPIGKEAYVYDPASGRVTCPHPGHEKY
ncbi:MAG TPA: prepilin-type N-terminal cleavage/methylation domain-containing protein [Fimbriimonas sp.]|nr:prepilin-type N-terminal cleavage/methylation domain-containing protein [Fimbriimonas sp.]